MSAISIDVEVHEAHDHTGRTVAAEGVVRIVAAVGSGWDFRKLGKLRERLQGVLSDDLCGCIEGGS